jgi:hypothetical protein
MLETLDAMIARVEQELAAEPKIEQGIYFRGR